METPLPSAFDANEVIWTIFSVKQSSGLASEGKKRRRHQQPAVINHKKYYKMQPDPQQLAVDDFVTTVLPNIKQHHLSPAQVYRILLYQ